jgi:hypothetical protein
MFTHFLPLWILAFLTVLSLGINMGRHGQPHDPYNAWTSVFSIVIEWGLILWFLAINDLL